MEETIIIPIVELDQFKLLPVPTQKIITDISSQLQSKSLMVFNPLVESMTNIEAFRTIKYDPKDEDTIKAFKGAKSTIRSFRSATGKAKKQLKAPYLLLGKNIDKIENTFKESATDVLDLLEVEFKPYLDELEVKKKAKEDKKNKVIIEAMDELTEESIQNNLIIARMNAFNLYSKNIFGFNKRISDKVADFSKESLQAELLLLDQEDLVISNEDKNSLLPEQVTELQENFTVAIDNAKTMISMKIAEFDLSIKEQAQVLANGISKDIHVAAEEIEVEIEEIDVEKIMGGVFEAPSISEDDPEYFKTSVSDIISEAIEKISELKALTTEQESVKNKVVTSFSTIQDKINAFLT